MPERRWPRVWGRPRSRPSRGTARPTSRSPTPRSTTSRAELVATGRVSDATYARAVAALGEAGLVDLVGVVGYYTLVAFTLNAREVPAPDGAPRLA